MYSYDSTRFSPAAPVATVSLRDLNATSTVQDVLLLIDTGADVTLIPKIHIDRLGVKSLEGLGYELVGFDGKKTTAEAVDLDMIFLNRAYRGRYLLIDGEYGILGRDILNEVALILNGPQQTWQEYRP